MSNQRADGPTVILGLGNPLRGDDGVGPRVVAELERRGLPDGVLSIDAGTGGLRLLDLLAEAGRAIVVDAAEMDLPPGRCRRFTVDDASLAGSPDRRSHEAGLAETLALAGALGHPLPQLVIFGVQPESMGWGEGISPAVEAALPEILDAVLQEARAGQAGPG